MKKFLLALYVGSLLVVFGWLALSYLEVIAYNVNNDGHVYSQYNFFKLLVNKAL